MAALSDLSFFLSFIYKAFLTEYDTMCVVVNWGWAEKCDNIVLTKRKHTARGNVEIVQ